ncbi:MAG: hypothetical protein Hyperionvirus3_68 [Hyperionvirus sp.]|uniref:Uncharacterized protein n=1 Tax=Hyperionvirus sp. TaxID=2487770 RepID=A0A3G5A7A4_9VIRU|nr:MAG: hypothetical protein Hyperionvirus3_68 [Hyperionvirus sp.]
MAENFKVLREVNDARAYLESRNDSKLLRNPEFRDQMWLFYIGPYAYEALCQCCGTRPIFKQLRTGGFELGHVISKVIYDNHHYTNLRLICGGCNKAQGMKNMDDFMNENRYEPHENWNGFKESFTETAHMDLRNDGEKVATPGKIRCEVCQQDYVNMPAHLATAKHQQNLLKNESSNCCNNLIF